MMAYLKYFKLRIATELQYRAAAIAGILTQLFFCAMFIMFYVALYKSNNTAVTPMSMKSLVSYLWLQQAFFAMTYTSTNEKEMVKMIKDGNLAYELIRPQNFYIKFFVKMFAHRFANCLLRFLPVIIIGFIIPSPYGLYAPDSIGALIIFILAIIVSGLLITALTEIINIITMFTMDDKGIRTIFGVVADTFTGNIVPLPFFPIWLRKIADILPFKYISDFPYRTYTGDILFNTSIKYLFMSIFWMILFIIIGYLISKVALKKAVIQGG